MALTLFHSLFKVKEPSTAECLQNSDHQKEVGTQVMIDHIKQDEAPIAAEWKRTKESNEAKNEHNEHSWSFAFPSCVTDNS